MPAQTKKDARAEQKAAPNNDQEIRHKTAGPSMISPSPYQLRSDDLGCEWAERKAKKGYSPVMKVAAGIYENSNADAHCTASTL